MSPVPDEYCSDNVDLATVLKVPDVTSSRFTDNMPVSNITVPKPQKELHNTASSTVAVL
jgi:hypothetical protein